MTATVSSFSPSSINAVGRTESFLRKKSRTIVFVRRKLGKTRKEIVDQILAQGGSISPEQVKSVGGDCLEMGRTLLDIVRKGSDRLKEHFAFALFALQLDVLLKIVHTDFIDELTRQCRNDFLQLEGDFAAKHAFRRRMFLKLEDLDRDVVIVVVGNAGVGKSTLVKALLCSFDSHAKMLAPSEGLQYETDPKVYCAHLNVPGRSKRIRLRISDCPGYQSSDSSAAKKMYQALQKRVDRLDLLLLCIAVNGLTIEGSLSIEYLTAAFGNDIWKKVIVLWTKADLVRPPFKNESNSNFYEVAIEKLERHYRQFLKENACLSQDIVDGIKYLPTGRSQELANGRDWLPEFWTAALEKATIE